MAEARFELYERTSGTRLASGTLRNLAEQLGSAGTSYTSVLIRARKLHGEDVALNAIAPEYRIADYLDGGIGHPRPRVYSWPLLGGRSPHRAPAAPSSSLWNGTWTGQR